MSGIVGIINLDGAPVERQLLEQMTDFMAYRGPDGQDIWIDGHVGFGHTMLRTTTESLRERQPYSLDGQVWITADARVDGRKDLIQKLASKGRTHLEALTDPDLILHAYHAWGEGCVEHLVGDFAFAIWDRPRQRLFCARDHFGVKPFYYAQVGNSLIFSNTLNSIRMHPAVSDELNELAIADFLLFGFNQDLGTTTFADIHRLPPAHYLTWAKESPHIIRYWTLPTDGHIRYRRASDYVDHFRELFRTAVGDRLRTDRLGILMSGGVDSTAVAATACELLSDQPQPFDLRAYCVVYDHLIPDEERYYSGLVAKSLGIPIHYLVADDYKPFERWGDPELRTPEPIYNPLAAIEVDLRKDIGVQTRTALTGEGGDPSLRFTSRSYFAYHLRGMRMGPLLMDVWEYVLSYRQLPPRNLRTRVKRLARRLGHSLGKRPWRPPFPNWLNGAFADRLHLRGRWEKSVNAGASSHPVRPEAYTFLTLPDWPAFFENDDPGVTLFPVESRHPFFDIRLVNYLLAIPPMFWCVDKGIVRLAMRGRLPDEARRRPKAPLAGDPLLARLSQLGAYWMDNVDGDLAPWLGKYVVGYTVPYGSRGKTDADAYELWVNLRPLALSLWFAHLKPVTINPKRSNGYEITRGGIGEEILSHPAIGSLRRYP